MAVDDTILLFFQAWDRHYNTLVCASEWLGWPQSTSGNTEFWTWSVYKFFLRVYIKYIHNIINNFVEKKNYMYIVYLANHIYALELPNCFKTVDKNLISIYSRSQRTFTDSAMPQCCLILQTITIYYNLFPFKSYTFVSDTLLYIFINKLRD